ncbi:MAG: SOS response-associated peptidase family protein [Pseudomonas sp.]
MCYSARAWQDYRKYVRKFGADMDIKAFVELYMERRDGKPIKTPKAMDDSFEVPGNDDERLIHSLVAEHNASVVSDLEKELFEQTKRLNDAERTLQTKTTKKATEDRRIATNKIERAKQRLADLRRSERKDRDARIFPGQYAPVMVWDQGRKTVMPMRYQCRPAGKPAIYDRKYPGTYNARRDNLEGFWKGQFGHSHGLMVVEEFFENVTGEDGKNKVLRFRPKSGEPMLVACLWSRWTAPDGEQLLSFAAITDEPTPEVAAAGHDRLIISIKPEHVDAWLNPDPGNLEALYRIFDDRQPDYYEHQLAA